jgi:hypothetical protein
LATLNGAKFPTLEESGLLSYNQEQTFDKKSDEALEKYAQKRLEEIKNRGK